MTKIILFVFVILIIFVTSKHIVKRLVGGFPASPGQFPFHVSIRDKYNHDHFCGGAIIQKKFVITAAHCLINKRARDIYIVAGATRLSDQSTIYTIKKIFMAKYNYTNFANDIGVIKLSRKIKYTPTIQPIGLQLSKLPSNSQMVVSGWGLKHFGDLESPKYLQYEEVFSISPEECMHRFNDSVVIEKHICTYTKAGEGVCLGDSGSPLVFQGKLVGIVSWGRLPCAAGYPDVYTKVSKYHKWIQSIIKTI